MKNPEYTLKAKLEKHLLAIWFNQQTPGLVEKQLLGALTWVYGFLRRLGKHDEKTRASKKTLNPPVLVIGNLTAGGTGKTPLVAAACQHILGLGKQVGIVSRGYGTDIDQIIYVAPGSKPNAAEIGDEPAELALKTGCPMCIGRDRQAAVNALLKHHPNLNLIISDDGLQHHRMVRSHEWVVFDARAAGNRKLIPAGPLREPLSRLKTIDEVVLTQGDLHSLSQSLKHAIGENWHATEVELMALENLTTGETLNIGEWSRRFSHRQTLAFTGLGNPQKFFNLLNKMLSAQFRTRALPDHFRYPPDFCSELDADILLVTQKDAVKLPKDDERIWVAQIHANLPKSLKNKLENYLGLSVN